MLIVSGKIQDYGIFLQKYPNVCGTDVAGEIYEVGEGVTQFKKGDRVFGYVIGGRVRSRVLQDFRLIVDTDTLSRF